MARRISFRKNVRGTDCTKENKQETTKKEAVYEIGYLAAFSGNLAGKNLHPYFVPPVYDLLQPEGFFKIEEEQISSINIRIRELENNRSYLDLKEKWKTETEQAKAILNQAKAELKAAKEAREIRRQSPSTLSEEEQASLIRESQYQKAEYKRLEKEWKKRLEELETETRHFETEIEQLKTERKDVRQPCKEVVRAVPDAECQRRSERPIHNLRADSSESSSCRCG